MTLLSTDTGWAASAGLPWAVNGAIAPYALVDTQNWRLAELNGDDRADLVHFTPTASGVKVEYLLATGQGTWTSQASDHFQDTSAPGGALTRQDVASFRSADLNKDGYTDFVHVEAGGSPSSPHYTIRTLLSRGPTQWEEQSFHRLQHMDSQLVHQLQIMDFNGDTISDLGRPTTVDGCIQVQAYIRSGDSWTSVTGSAPTPCQSATGLGDRRNLRLADVNRDGRTDAYHLSRTGHAGTPIGTPSTAQATIATLLNPTDPTKTSSWRFVDQTSLQISDADAWAWIYVDSDHDGVAELAHLGGSDPDMLKTLRWGAADDRLTGIDNGRGATTSISYQAQAASRTYLPPGLLPKVVDSVSVTDNAYTPALVSITGFDYDHAQWSTQHRSLIGFGTIIAHQGSDTIVETGRELTDSCGARISRHSVAASDGAVISQSMSTFEPTGSAPPHTCRTETVTDFECERSNGCPTEETGFKCKQASACRAKKTVYAYDAYGNVETTDETGGSLRRRTYSPVHPNLVNYVVNRPYLTETQIPLPEPTSPPRPPIWFTVTRTLFGYDDESWQHPPKQQGDLTRVTAYSSIGAGEASETFYAYDSAGNRRLTIAPAAGPVGITTEVIYDPGRHLFPEKSCPPVGCTTTIWDEVLGVPKKTIDPNGAVITNDYDKYGRLTSTTNFDRYSQTGTSTTSIDYLDTGVVTGPADSRQRTHTKTTDGSPNDGVRWHDEYLDGLGRVYRTVDEGPSADPATNIETRIQYHDASDQPAAQSLPYRGNDRPRWTTYAYDPAYRVTTVTHPGSTGATAYTSRTYVVGAVEDRDELNHLTTKHHDEFGRTTQVDEHVTLCGSCPITTQSTHYGYDITDRLTSIEDPAHNLTTIVRDGLGREKTVTDPDRGQRTLTWYDNGNLDTETDANGTHHWTYDFASRPQTRTDTNQTQKDVTNWSYDTDPGTHAPQGSSIGRLTRVTYRTDGAAEHVEGSDSYTYDDLGRVRLSKQCIDNTCVGIGYTYDQAGRVTDVLYPQLGDPDGERVHYTYDPAGNLTSVGDFLKDIHYNAAGLATQQTYGNGLTETFEYDPNRLWRNNQTLMINPTSPPIYRAVYTHSPTAQIETLSTTNGINSTFIYTYDEIGRLTRAVDPPFGQDLTYSYDQIGRLALSPAGTYQYSDSKHLHAPTGTTSGHVRQYDSAGNLKYLHDPSGRTLNIESTVRGMPAKITTGNQTTTMAYDSGEQRVKRVDPNMNITRFYGRYVEQDNTIGMTKYYWASDQLVAKRTPGGDIEYILQRPRPLNQSHHRPATDRDRAIQLSALRKRTTKQSA